VPHNLVFEKLARERILILGAGGWFGHTFLDMLSSASHGPVLAMTGHRRRVSVGRREWFLRETNMRTISSFAPTLVVNFAFLTRDRERGMGTRAYTEANETLTQTLLEVVALPSINRAITISSGAARTEPQSAYGRLKEAEELSLKAMARDDKTIVIGRAYSLSGPFVQRPADYAFSNLIQQAPTGEIRIEANTPVLRRYVSVRDFLMVLLAEGSPGDTAIIESGGELVEIGDLARRVVSVLGFPARIQRASLRHLEPSAYASNGESWMKACQRTGLQPESLEDQIRATARGLISWKP
jgi:nucleoside-diphosphate-sugar epimerase